MPSKLTQLVAILLCGALIFGAAQFIPRINEGRQALNAFGDEDILKSTPPEYAFAIQAFGAFRSLIVNIAFIRAETFKEEGRFYDAMQLASWICTLQPRFPSVWSFQSWNMAWNISVSTFTPEERWTWVYNGLKLLRDQGIPYNPNALGLYRQLAWIYNNKISENLDDHHWDYKREWAWRMHLLFGPYTSTLAKYRPTEEDFEPVALGVTEDPLAKVGRTIAERQAERRQRRAEEEGLPHRTTKSLEELLAEVPEEEPAGERMSPAELAQRAVLDQIQTIEAAPQTLAALYAEVPETREMVRSLRAMGVSITDDPLTEEEYWFGGKLAETFFARYRELADTPALREQVARDEGEDTTPTERALNRFDEIVGVTSGSPAGKALLHFLQRKVLEEVYRLDPSHMAYVVANFGPVDWRAPDAHSLYWVSLGLKRAGASPTDFQTDRVNTARIIFFSLRNLFNRNRITFEPNPDDIHESYLNFGRDPNFIEPMHEAFITYGPMLDPDPGNAGGAGSIFRTGHVNFLTEAIRTLYFSDRIAEANHYYRYLRENYGRTEYEQRLDRRYLQTLDEFVIHSLYENVTSPRETRRVIADLLFQAYHALAGDDVKKYNRLATKAMEFWAEYMEEKAEFRGPRLKLPPFSDIQIDVFHDWFAVPAYSSNSTLYKARLWHKAPVELQRWVYDDLIDMFRAECNAWDFDVAKAFPEPPDMAAFREAHPRRVMEKRETDVETPAQPAGD